MATTQPDQSAPTAARQDPGPSYRPRRATTREPTIFDNLRVFNACAVSAFLLAGLLFICRVIPTPLSKYLFSIKDGKLDVAQPWVSLPLVVLLVFLSFYRLEPLRWRPRWLISGSGIITFILSAALSIVLPGPLHTEVAIFALAFAALVIGGQHIAEFAVNHEKLEAASEKIAELTDLFAFTEYRATVQEAFKKATKRIISVTNLWPIDDEWWDDLDWKSCSTYTCLVNRPERMLDIESVKFVGEMPWPKYGEGTNQAPENEKDLDAHLSEEEFEKFLGLMWRLVVVDKARERINEENEKNPDPEKRNRRAHIDVVVGSIPIAATVVDDDVFILLDTAYDSDTKPRGTQLTRRSRGVRNLDKAEADKLDKETADAYENLMDRYLQCVRSGREYVHSILRLASFATSRLKMDDCVFFADGGGPSGHLEYALDVLGRKQWARQRAKAQFRKVLDVLQKEKESFHGLYYATDRAQTDIEGIAAKIAHEFFTCYGPEGAVTFKDLGHDLL